MKNKTTGKYKASASYYGCNDCLVKTKKAAEHWAVFVLKMREREISRTLTGDVTTFTLLEELLGVNGLFPLHLSYLF